MSVFNRSANLNSDLPPGGPGGPDSYPQAASGGLPSILGYSPRRNPMIVAWERRWIILTCLLLALASAIVYLVLATPIYQSRAQILVEQNTPRVIASDPTGGMVMAGSQNFLWNQCRLLNSPELLKPVASDPNIRALPSFPAGSDPVGRMRGMISATVGKRDDIITISVDSEYPDDAARIANAVIFAFTKFHESAKKSSARELLDLLQNKKGELDEQLRQKRKEKLDFEMGNAGFSLGPDRVNPTMERMVRLSQVLTEYQIATIDAQAAFDQAKAIMDDPVKARQLLETRQFKGETIQLRAEVRDLQQRLAGLSKNYLPGFPELTAIQNSIKQLNDEMAAQDRKIIEAYVSELEAQLNVVKRKADHIATLLYEQKEEVLQLNTTAAQYALLLAELRSLEQFYDVIYNRIKEVSLTEEAAPLTVRTVESAVPSYTPVHPNKPLTLLYALLVGALAGTGLAFLRDWLDQRLRSADEIKQVLGLTVLGVVPHIAGATDPKRRGTFLHLEPMSDVAEAYRTIRTAIYFGQPGGVAKTLLITSPAPGDGKTTLASNLAIAMAQAGNKILLLDADFRKPTQHKIFDIDKRVGLSSVLAGEAQLKQVIHSTQVQGLDVLPCGPIPANPSEILNSQTFADLLDELCNEYDHVLLDSPPVMPVTDARILAASCDATVLALRAEKSTRKGAVYSRDMLAGVGSHILGVVVNDVPRKKSVYGYYYTYGEEGYRYGYGYGAQRRPATGGRGAPVPAPAGNEKGNGAAHATQAHATQSQASTTAVAEKPHS
jgi:capsular exopolysaccharide synthesis family protein